MTSFKLTDIDGIPKKKLFLNGIELEVDVEGLAKFLGEWGNKGSSKYVWTYDLEGLSKAISSQLPNLITVKGKV